MYVSVNQHSNLIPVKSNNTDLYLRFVLEAFPKKKILLETDGHQLDGHIAPKVRIIRQVYRSHASPTQLRLNFVPCDRFSHHLMVPTFGRPAFSSVSN
jgi:hypothetical protein